MSNDRDSFTVPYSIDRCLAMLYKTVESKNVLKRYNLYGVEIKIYPKNTDTALLQTMELKESSTAQLVIEFEAEASGCTKITYVAKTPSNEYFYALVSFGFTLLGLVTFVSAKTPLELSCYIPFTILFASVGLFLHSSTLTLKRNLTYLVKDTFSKPLDNWGIHWSDTIANVSGIGFVGSVITGCLGMFIINPLNIETKHEMVLFYFLSFILIFAFGLYVLYMPVLSMYLLFRHVRYAQYQKFLSELKIHKLLNLIMLGFVPVFKQWEGSTLLTAGLIDEAERFYLSKIETKREMDDDKQKRSLKKKKIINSGDYEILCGLGNVFVARQSYDLALEFFEHAQLVQDNRSGLYFHMAKLYLMKGDNPQSALENLVLAEKFTDTSWLGRMFDEHALPRIYAARAWAYAQMQEFEQAESAIMQALEPCPRDFYPGQADLHYKIGQTKLLMNDPASAKQHFQLAADFDPNGYFGSLARQALNELF